MPTATKLCLYISLGIGLCTPRCAMAEIVCSHTKQYHDYSAFYDAGHADAGGTGSMLANYVAKHWPSGFSSDAFHVGFHPDGIITANGNSNITCADVMTVLKNHGSCMQSSMQGYNGFNISCTDASAAVLNAAIQPVAIFGFTLIIAVCTLLMTLTSLVLAAVWLCGRKRRRAAGAVPIYGDDSALLGSL